MTPGIAAAVTITVVASCVSAIAALVASVAALRITQGMQANLRQQMRRAEEGMGAAFLSSRAPERVRTPTEE